MNRLTRPSTRQDARPYRRTGAEFLPVAADGVNS